MTVQPTEPVAPDPVYAGLQAKVFEAVAAAARDLGVAPGTLTTRREPDGSRYGAMYFDNINDAGAWADRLHWAYATANRADKIVFTAYGQWLGFSWQILASETLIPVPAPAHREG